MSKPTKQIVAKQGSKTYKVLDYLLDHPELTFETYGEAAEYLDQEFLEINLSTLKEIVSYYNQGLYDVGGRTSDNQMILITPNQKTYGRGGVEVKQSSNSSSGTEDYQTEDRKTHNSLNYLSAFVDGRVLNLNEFCEHYNLLFDDLEAKSCKLVTHNGGAYYNIVFKDKELDNQIQTWNDALDKVRSQMKVDRYFKTKHTPKTSGNSVGVVHISDIHLGAFVQDLIHTPDYNVEVVKQKLTQVVAQINNQKFDRVVVNFLGDLIESFSGLNHINTWKETEQGIFGAKVVKLCAEILDEFLLSKIENLEKVNMIGGNHGRASSDNKEDTKAGAEDLISWGLKLMGYDITFNPLLISDNIDGIQYILTHGDKKLTNRPSSDLIVKYGNQNIFNLLISGHLHSRIQKLSANQIDKFHMVDDDNPLFRKIVAPSIFTGNSYSDDNGWHTSSGFIMTTNNGNGVPIVIDIPI